MAVYEGGKFLKEAVVLRRWGVLQDNLVLSTELIIRVGHRKEIRRKEIESLYNGQFTLSTQLIKPNYVDIVHWKIAR